MSAALVLLAHHDDEFFLAPVIRDECIAGTAVAVAYLTHGSRFGAGSDDGRMQESRLALAHLGVAESRIAELGAGTGIYDGELMYKAGTALTALAALYAATRFARIYLMAWEGGHTDHDAAHAIGAAYAARAQPEARRFEFPLYNCHHMGAGLFQVMRLGPGPGSILERRLAPEEAGEYLGLFGSYRSQREVLAVLKPGITQALTVRGSYRYRELAAPRDLARPPHGGPLFYEQRFGTGFAEFRAALSSQGL
jgi:LmbE family N-acetylglucosaminyl deacetylase